MPGEVLAMRRSEAPASLGRRRRGSSSRARQGHPLPRDRASRRGPSGSWSPARALLELSQPAASSASPSRTALDAPTTR
jgi:hypothetical protein